eukprot:Plantae.Rhodophyta-Purpureofilum_apyrenoidigerum.ctg17320.p1 GENE.Plantae.Rhodophyta-Purpureofilum_apyrenoidigerum.ctg17320~~Plantae.Rhodophyta-Purpureofilum_apyrenoidigerum.ctg17320.p1  ORF type:complete len:812 (+),score=225.60 Plantae.Rhodophyta-Purpureofilum_apyrenoidigerum.ctg17320:310-2745(+)
MGDVDGGDTSVAKNVSDQIEGEGQLEGLNTDAGKTSDVEDVDNNEAGFEMSNDFDGQVGNDEKKNDEDGSDDDDMDKPNADKVFGENDAEAEVLDEKLWDEEDSKEEEKEEQVNKGKDIGKSQGDTELGRKDDDSDKEHAKDSNLDLDQPDEKVDHDDRMSNGEEENNEDHELMEEVQSESAMQPRTDKDIDNRSGDEESIAENLNLDAEDEGSAVQSDEDSEMGDEGPPVEDAHSDDSDDSGSKEIVPDAKNSAENFPLDEKGDVTEDDLKDSTAAGQDSTTAATDANMDRRGASTGGPVDEQNDDSTWAPGLADEKAETEELSAHDKRGDEGMDGIGQTEPQNADDELNPSTRASAELVALWSRRRQLLQAQFSSENTNESGRDDTQAVAFNDHGDDVEFAAAAEDNPEGMEGIEAPDKEPPIELRTDERRRQPGRQPAPLDESDKDKGFDRREEIASGEDNSSTVGELKHTDNARKTHAEPEKSALNQRSAPDAEIELDVEELREEVANVSVEADKDERLSPDEAERTWKRLQEATSNAAGTLCEQLRLILEPTVASRLEGNFRTGKRLSMRRVIEFVASDFRRDRIWLRRTKADKRSYDVLLCIDDSESMIESGAGLLALEALALISSALYRLEVGRMSVVSFGESPKVLHDFTDSRILNGTKIISEFRFDQQKTNVRRLLEFASDQLDDARLHGATGSGGETAQLVLIISDGKIGDRDGISAIVRKATTERQMIALLLIDNASDENQSLQHVKKVVFESNGKMKVESYLDDFPFPFYAVLKDIARLPNAVADTLRQWFELVNANIN